MIQISSNFDIINRLKELFDNLRYLDTLSDGDYCDFKNISFVTPISIIPIAAIINKKHLKVRTSGDGSEYLNVICFPPGIPEVKEPFRKKTYLPIIHLVIDTLDSQWLANQLDKLHEHFLQLLRTNIIADQIFLQFVTEDTMGFLVGESLDNIKEHSNAQNIYIFAQYWPAINSCEICIVDDGKGFLGSLKSAGRDVLDSMDALKKVIEKGLSAKTGDPDSIRGTGIKNIRDAITNHEINGEFILISGDAGFVHTAKHEKKLMQIKDYFWQGTVVSMKLNKPPNVFNLYHYVK
ncbi:MAG TPA: hypothetical protein PK711_02445 [Bacteroidales bacterium]|nr:hypothetical protein [Bacteroidales bacterium]